MKKENFFDDDISKHFPEEYQIFFENLSGSPFSVPHGADVAGPIAYGFLADTSERAAFLLEELNQNTFLTGRAGSGKTTESRVLAYQLMPLVPCWFFDFKRDYRHFLQYTKDLLIFRWKDFRINPLRPPPGTDPVEWIQIFADIFCISFALLAASKALLANLLYELYELYGVFKGSDVYPTILDLHEKLEKEEKVKGLSYDKRGYLARLDNKAAVCATITRDIFDCDEGYSLEMLLQKNIVFELDGLMDELQTLFVNTLLAWVSTYKLDRAERGTLRQVIFLDEASKIFKKDYKSELGTPYMEQMVRRIREFGVGFVFADQMPHTLSDVIKSNVFATICLSLSNGKDIEDIAKMMRLTAEQADFLNKLPVGQGIVKLADRWPEPFHVVIPDFPLERFVTDEEVERHMRSYYGT
jgi:hypothetical protein